MLFNSLEFLMFFPIVTLLYFIVPHKFRWLLLLTASFIFYITFIPIYVFLLSYLIIIDYIAGILIEKAKTKKTKKSFLLISIISTVSILFFFKYFNFFSENFNYLANLIHWNYSVDLLKLILPIGLSFHTFQSLSYVIEVYRGNQKAERKFGIYALYVMFYPQLVAGPIERPQNLLHQFYEKYNFDYKRVTDGLKRMLWGFFKKIVIADNLAVVVNTVYSDPTSYTGFPLILATFFFAFQIFADFSGYTDIALGAAKVMGFRLMENFRRPYFSKSISEFWNRWHISLSTWFRDYLYIPLGGNRVSFSKWYRNIIIVFLVTGLWHGSKWTFVIWGALHGFYIIITLLTEKIREKKVNTWLYKHNRLNTLIKIIITFALVDIGWIFFRSNSLSDAFYIITHLFNLSLDLSGIKLGGVGVQGVIISFCLIGVMELFHILQRKRKMSDYINSKPIYIRWSIYIMLIWAIILLGVFESKEFIYFQF